MSYWPCKYTKNIYAYPYQHVSISTVFTDIETVFDHLIAFVSIFKFHLVSQSLTTILKSAICPEGISITRLALDSCAGKGLVRLRFWPPHVPNWNLKILGILTKATAKTLLNIGTTCLPGRPKIVWLATPWLKMSLKWGWICTHTMPQILVVRALREHLHNSVEWLHK